VKSIKWIAIILTLTICGFVAWRYSTRSLENTKIALSSIVWVHGDANPRKGLAVKNAIAELNRWLGENKSGWKIACDDPSSTIEFKDFGALSIKIGGNFVNVISDDRIYCLEQKNDDLLKSLKAALADGQKLADKEDEETAANETRAEEKRLASLPSCNVVRKEKIAFENNEKKNDDLLVQVVGKPCYNATYSIEIKSANGKILYSYKANFKPHIAIQWDDPGLDGDAERLVSETGDSNWTTMGKLPKDLKNETFEEDYLLKVSKAKYSQLHKLNLPIFRHLTGYESWQLVVFDPDLGKAVVLISGGS
jgi:hypothetical protein